jgi:TolB-like protein/Tfp pilus assembly protein PilF
MGKETKPLYEFGPFRVDARERRLLREGVVVPLTPKVFDILLVLVENGGHLLSKDEVIKIVWPDTAVEEANLTRNISTLRKALGESRDNPHYIETIPWLGYRFVAEVKKLQPQPDKLGDSLADGLTRPIESVAVLPFINEGGDSDADYLSDGMTESLINNLSRLTSLKVMSRNSVFHYKARGGQNDHADAQRVGRELGVQAVLTGRIAQRGEELLVSVELSDARDNRHLWGERYRRPFSDLFAVQEEIAREIAEKLRLRLTGEEEQRLSKRETENPEAYRLYLKGRYHWNKMTMEGVQKGIAYFEQAIEKDPHYALAYAGLVDCYNYLGKPTEAKQAAEQALHLDETLGEARASLAFFRFLYDWDWAGAEREFKRAIELSPNYAQAHHWYAIFLGNLGRPDEAISEAQLAQELDPLSLLNNLTVGLVLYMARHYDRALEELTKTLEMDANFLPVHSSLGAVYLQQGRYDQAITEYQKVMEFVGDNVTAAAAVKANIGHIYAVSGRRRKATQILNDLLKQPDGFSFLIAELYAGLGESDQAFAWLNKACDEHNLQIVSLKVLPTLDSLRRDPRFADLLRRVGLSRL